MVYAMLLVAIFSSFLCFEHCSFFLRRKETQKSLQKSIDDDVNDNSAKKNDTTSFGIKYTTVSIRNNLQDVT